MSVFKNTLTFEKSYKNSPSVFLIVKLSRSVVLGLSQLPAQGDFSVTDLQSGDLVSVSREPPGSRSLKGYGTTDQISTF